MIPSRTFTIFLAFGAIGGIVFRLLFDSANEREWGHFAQSATQGLLLAAALWAVDAAVGAAEARLKTRPPLPISLAVRSIALTAAIVVSLIASESLFMRAIPSWAWFAKTIPLALALALPISFLFQAAVSVARLIGIEEILSFLLGRYRRPIAEDRIVLFADVIGSTRIAESLGETRTQKLLAEMFRCIDPVFRERGGRIVTYVGDEVVVTWPGAAGNADLCLDCGCALTTILARRAPQFLSDYGVAPELRVTAHAGDVAIGEIGESRKQIALLGDVVNVAARIQELGKTLDARFIVSAELLGRAGPAWGRRSRPLGPQVLRGRSREIELFSVAADIGT